MCSQASLHRVSWWGERLTRGELDDVLGEIYDEPAAVDDRGRAFTRLLDHFGVRFGTRRDVILARCPCRVNLMGMHVEHRGGYVNYVTHGREILAVGAPRVDDTVRITDVRSDRFPEREFTIADEIEMGNSSSWLEYIDSPSVVKRVASNQGDWSNYVRASVLRLQIRFDQRDLRGFDAAFLGDIPTSSGLSSSSAMVVLSSLLTLELNSLEVDRAELVELCGEGEWYVGTRGGAGDHAAMLFCERDRICHLRFFPFEVDDQIPLPDDCSIVICDSMKSARKAGEVLDAYNQTIAAYNMVLILAKGAMGDLGLGQDLIDGTEHLRDMNPERIPLADIYRVIKALPEMETREDLLRRFPEQVQDLERLFRTHKPPSKGYRIRSVAMFGIAECERGKVFANLMRSGDVEEIGRLMSIEHDGDRVVEHDPERDEWKPWDNHVTESMLDQLIEDCESESAAAIERSKLHLQSGGYGCSSPELDQMVDIAASVPGVLGAGLTGAGFGGCIRVLVRDRAVEELLSEMRDRYYAPRGLPMGAEVLRSARGACILPDRVQGQ